jgi:DNA replication protein DnaC
MSDVEFSRSKALNNIPSKKLKDKQLEFISKCEECKSKSSISDGLCKKCSGAMIAFTRYYESNIPVEYWQLKMERDFVGDKKLLDKYNDLVSDVRKCFLDGTAICLAGNNGTGKTFTCTSILKTAVLKGYSGLYTTFSDMITTLTQASNEEKFLAKKELVMADFVVIDEVDNRYIGSENMADLYARLLEIVVRTRRQNKLPTFICTNSPNITQSFSGALKQSIESILSGYMETFIVFGDDFRKNKK